MRQTGLECTSRGWLHDGRHTGPQLRWRGDLMCSTQLSFLACHDEQPKHTDEQVLKTGQGSRIVMAKSVMEG